MSCFFFSQKYFDLLKLIILKRRNTAQKYFISQNACICKMKMKEQYSVGNWPNTDVPFFSFPSLFLLLYHFSTNT